MESPKTWAPWIKITDPQVILPAFITSLVVEKKEGRHAWAQVCVRYSLPNEFRPALGQIPPSLWWPEDTPIRLVFGPNKSLTSEFVGYVVSPELLNDGTITPAPYALGQTVDIRYTILGASKPMQSAKDRAWRSCTSSYMAQHIGEENGFVSLTSPHPRVFEVRQQAGQSDFAFLQARAAETGQRLVVDGTRLFLTDPRQQLVRQVPSFQQHNVAGIQDTMQSFRAVVGETDPSGLIRAEHVATRLSRAGVVTKAQTLAPRVDPVSGRNMPAQVRRVDARHVAHSYTDADAVTQAAAVRDLWWVTASATVDGDTSLMPGCVVQLGGDALTEQYAGEWMVRCARHRLTFDPRGRRWGSYYTDVELGRDQADRLTVVRGPVVRDPGSALVGSRWVAKGRLA